MSEVEPVHLVVSRAESKDQPAIEIGRVDFAPDGELTLISATQGNEDLLYDAIDSVNDMEELRLKVPPPADAPQFSVYVLSVKRSSPKLLDYMRDLFAQKFGLVLTPSGGAGN